MSSFVDDPFARLWWMLALRGLAGVLFGALAIAWPLFTLEALLAVFGVYVTLDGVVALVAGVQRGRAGWTWWPLAVEGALGLVAGGAILGFPDRAAFLLWYLVAGWAIASGVAEIVAAIRLRRFTEGETLLAGAGVASLVLGGLMIGWPSAAVLTVAWLIGLYAIIFGALLFALAVKLRRAAGPAPRARPRWVT